MFERLIARIHRGWVMAVAASRLVGQQPKLIAIAALPLLALVALVALIAYGPGGAVLDAIRSAPREWHTTLLLVSAFSGYLLIWFVITFCNTIMVLATLSQLDTGRVSVGECFGIAVSRLPQIIAWSIFAATIGLALNMLSALLKEKLGLIGSIIGVTFEATWAIATYFALPILVVEGVGPIDATQRSYQLMKRTWGESLGGNVGTGLLGLALMLPVLALQFWFAGSGGPGLGAMLPSLLLVTLLYVSAVSLFMAAVTGVLRSALYMFAVSGEAPRGFDPHVMSGAFQSRN